MFYYRALRDIEIGLTVLGNIIQDKIIFVEFQYVHVGAYIKSLSKNEAIVGEFEKSEFDTYQLE